MTSSGWGRKTGVYAASVAFALLAAVLAGLGAISVPEAMWAAASVALAFVPTGWWGSAGFHRRAAEAALVPAAFALTMVGGTAMRWMLVPPLLLLAAWTAVAVAWERTPIHRRPLLAAFLGLSARAAVGLGLIGFSAFATGVTLVVAAVAPWAAARRSGRRAAELAALGAAVIPWQRWPLITLAVLAACAAWGVLGGRRSHDVVVLRWLPGVGAAALLAASLAPWAGFPVSEIFPAHGWLARAAVVLALIITPRLRPGPAGAVWLLATLSLGPALAPSPEQRAFVLTEELGELRMSAGSEDPYVIDLAVRNGDDLADDVPLAVLRFSGADHVVRTGADGGETVWRPRGSGQSARWRPAVRRWFAVPAGERPVLYRHPDLPDGVEVRVETLGVARATPPRDWALPAWLLAAALAVAVIEVASGSWRQPIAALPWLVLILGSLVARAPVEPLRLLGERLSVDIALAAVLLAWLPAARRWLGRRQVFMTVAALLVPLALATPHLTPPLYGDEPFHLSVMDSLATDHDLDIADDLDLEHKPGNALYAPGRPLFHSPVLGALLLPGYLLAGRAGALVLLALMGGALAALIARRARALGLIEARVGLLVLLLAATYPVATFATQIWPELPGALAVAALLVLVAGPRGGRWLGMLIAVGAAAIKTRLGLLTFPIAAVAWLRRGRVRGLVMLGAATAAGLGIGWLTMGHPFGPYRRLHHLIPDDPGLVARVLGGLAFDPAGGLAFTAPLLLVALAGVAALWRRGGPGERALLVGGGLTLAALLHSSEWYGGGAPPARYLVPMLPAFALAGTMLLIRPLPWRRLGLVLLPPSVIAWWVLITRPHYSVNPGDGGYWLADALSRRFAADGRALFPSFLVPNTATWIVPVVMVGIVLLAAWLATRSTAAAAVMRRSWIALWLVAAAGLVLTLGLRFDSVVEVEAPQVRKSGGSPMPPAGTVSRFSHRRAWRLDPGNRVTVPLHLRSGTEVVLEGWLMGKARHRGWLEVRWDEGDTVVIPWRGEGATERVPLPPPPGPGHHRLGITLRSPPQGAAALDRLVLNPGEEPPG